MGDILFLAHRIPYPPNKGDKIRSWHILDHLSRRRRVHLGCFVDDPDDRRHIAFLRQRCGDTCFIDLDRRWAKVKSAAALLTGDALSLRFYASRRLAAWVADTIARHEIDAILAYSSTAAPFALPYIDGGRRVVMDFVDVDSEKWRQYADERRGLAHWIYAREGRCLADFERAVAEKVDASLFVSPAEADLFRRLAPAAKAVYSLANGVDTERFDPGVVAPASDLGSGPVIVFTGAMDYWANADAVAWFAETCWPSIKRQYPGAQFYIVGSHPTARVKALHGRAQITVTGRVDDVRPFVAAADVAVAPMRIARGVQNKVLEAMALARPVVTTTAGAEGIDVTAGEHLEVADDADAFALAVCRLIADKTAATAMGERARQQVCAKYGWNATLAPLDRLMGLAP